MTMEKLALRVEDHGGQVLARLPGKPWELGVFLRIAAALLPLIHQPRRGATKRRRPGCEGY